MAQRTQIWLVYGVSAALLGVLSYPVGSWLVRSWLSNPYYGHGFLVPVISSGLAWLQWRRVRVEPRLGNARTGFAVAAVSLAAMVWSMAWQNYGVAALALLALLAGLLLYLEGWARLRHWLFPLLFLTLMVPLPFVDRASPWFETFTARAATAFVRLVGIEAAQMGSQITLPGTVVVVGAPCSGLRSLVALAAIGILWVYLVQGRAPAKAAMLMAIIPLAALSNVVRIALLLVVAVVFGEQAALSYFHTWSSPILFLVALGLFLLLGKILRCSRLREDIF